MRQVKRFSLFKSFLCSLNGAFSVIKSERNIKLFLFLFLPLIFIIGWYLGISKGEWLILIFGASIILSAEAFNTTIEKTNDLLKDKLNLDYEETRLSRDMAAGATLFLGFGYLLLLAVIFSSYLQ